MLVLLGFFVLLRLLVAELAKIHQAANGGRRVGGDFDEIHAVGARQIEGFAQANDTELFAIYPDDPDFAGTDLPVNPDERRGRRSGTWSKRAAQDTLAG